MSRMVVNETAFDEMNRELVESTPAPESSTGVLQGLFALAIPLLLILAAALNPLDQSDATPAGSAGAGLTSEVALKLLLAANVGLVALAGWLLCPPVRQRLARFPGSVLVMLGVVLLGTSVVAYTPAANVSRAASLINGFYIVFAAVALHFLTLQQTIRCVLIGLVIHLVAAWALYWMGGDTAVYEEEFSQTLIVERMGSTAHPNSLGRIATLAIVTCLSLWRIRTRPMRPFDFMSLGFVFVIAAATILETMSRTAAVACAASVLAIMSDRLSNRRGLALSLLAAMTICLIVLSIGLLSEGSDVGSRVVAVGTKTGDVDELTSATGRTEIWAEAIRLIAHRPLTGWGLNSSPLLMEDYSHHTHNLLLHAFFSAGLFAGLCMAVLIGWTIYHGFTVVDPLFRGIAAYICVSGLFEDTAFETFPFASTLLWLLVLLAAADQRATDQRTADLATDADANEDEELVQTHVTGIMQPRIAPPGITQSNP
ncbi:O-antigen ligase family protein [Rhodopirellula sp. JC740]|uniref:O-antigen ligase family protein n=1 Tax=Rhodopirellula halodulae TaxID=2894198 RepID=A0ABS8NE12_9BACT|nr:O-antigen ligase family protein [Rhodopirellula sp. JC740]MCC9641796.1 O-antigen ligase family protein [Rhodopirellula sp. JC740]